MLQLFSHVQGRTYLCKKLDLDARVAVVRPAGGPAAYKPWRQLSAAAQTLCGCGAAPWLPAPVSLPGCLPASQSHCLVSSSLWPPDLKYYTK